MTDQPLATYAEVEAALLARWPETRLEPSLDRIAALVELLGDPQRTYPVVHLTGTNGKTSTARMVDGLLRGRGWRTGRFTSPHLQSMTERITVDGEPLSEEAFVAAYADVAPYLALVDLLGDPQRTYPVVHLTGTNGKTSTARMVDGLLRGRGWRTGRFTSPHLQSMTERITVDGEPLSEEAFVAAYADVAPYLALVDDRKST